MRAMVTGVGEGCDEGVGGSHGEGCAEGVGEGRDEGCG